MKCRTLIEVQSTDPSRYPDGTMPIGTVIEHPKAWLLVQQGIAEPADDECIVRADRTPEQIRAAQHAYIRATRGIHPDDFDAYDRGVMIGYDQSGRWIPGPNAIEQQTDSDDWWDELYEPLYDYDGDE